MIKLFCLDSVLYFAHAWLFIRCNIIYILGIKKIIYKHFKVQYFLTNVVP